MAQTDQLLTPQQQRDLLKRFPPNPWIFFPDMLAMAAMGWSLLVGAWWLSAYPLPWAVLTVASALAMYRGAYFLHEMAHRKPAELPGFEVVWHIVLGVPNLLPTLVIDAHAYHHRPSSYGTDQDPEYERVAAWSLPKKALEVVVPGLLPLVLPLRWGILEPLSVIPAVRRFTWTRLSTLAINPRFRRPDPPARRVQAYRIQSVACMLWTWAVAGAWLAGLVPTGLLAQWAVVLATALTINGLRTLVSHFFENIAMQTVSRRVQVLDSVTIDSWPIVSELFWPLGTKFHALHHACQGLPYHALGTAHRELMASLPEDAEYRKTVVPGFFASMRLLWTRRTEPRWQEIG